MPTTLPTTLPTFDELLGTDDIDESSIDAALYVRSIAPGRPTLQVFTLHAELEGMLLIDAFERLLRRWQAAGARITRMADIHALAISEPLPTLSVERAEIAGRSGLLAVQGAPRAAA